MTTKKISEKQVKDIQNKLKELRESHKNEKNECQEFYDINTVMTNALECLKVGNYKQAVYWLMKLENEKSSGKYGRVAEKMVKFYMNGKRGNSLKVSAKGKTDVQHHDISYEIKSNCGEINDNIVSNDYIIYSMDNVRDCERPFDWYVIPTNDWLKILDDLGLIRKKKATSGVIKTTIQSYKNSKKKTTLFENALAEYPTLDKWLLTH